MTKYINKVSLTFTVTLEDGLQLHEMSAMEWFETINTICENEFKAQLLEAVLNRSNWYKEIT